VNSIKEQLLILYCFPHDFLQRQKHQGRWRKSHNRPKFTEADRVNQQSGVPWVVVAVCDASVLPSLAGLMEYVAMKDVRLQARPRGKLKRGYL
jgi:hypothetical protein